MAGEGGHARMSVARPPGVTGRVAPPSPYSRPQSLSLARPPGVTGRVAPSAPYSRPQSLSCRVAAWDSAVPPEIQRGGIKKG